MLTSINSIVVDLKNHQLKEKHIAMVNFYKSGDELDVSGDEHIANSALIVCAPKLLKNCKLALEYFEEKLRKCESVEERKELKKMRDVFDSTIMTVRLQGMRMKERKIRKQKLKFFKKLSDRKDR